MKEKAYERLVEFCQELDQTADKDTVTKKINNLRSSFGKKYKKRAVICLEQEVKKSTSPSFGISGSHVLEGSRNSKGWTFEH